jgi:asparagine synthase (glutamine-hydrolysing)
VSVLFGMWNFDGHVVDPEHIARTRRTLEPLAPDGITVCVKGAFVMLYGAVHITEESRRERQPFTSEAGTFLMWDGRLDNRAELGRNLDSNSRDRTNLQIVASLWERRGAKCLADLTGDWALGVFNHYERVLFLAKDFLGTRPLYYIRCDRCFAWSSLLEPLVALADRLTVCERYLAGWLAGFPEAHLTPYKEICSVPPASFVRITQRATKVEQYWKFQPRPIRLKSDAECEEQFRVLFFESVRRRLQSATPVLAELSGGMDSSAIVCVADRLSANEGVPPVETASFFDDSEPNWNERPFFTAVETQRSHTGFHVNVASDGRLLPERDGSLPVTPAHGARLSESQASFSDFLAKGGFRVLLSGIGGDEFTGGVPTGVPELADLISEGNLKTCLRQAFLWSLASRKPLLHVVGRTVRSFLPNVRSRTQWPMPWVKKAFLRPNGRAIATHTARFRWFDPSPTFQENLRALDGLQRQIACAELPPSASCEKRYPFLDRDLLEFLFNVPREQLVRPNQRRSLVRRALRGIVPDMVLDRKRKAFAVTSELKAISLDWTRISELVEDMSLASRGVIDPKVLLQTLEEARRGEEVPLLSLTRTLRLEWWMEDPAIKRLFSTSQSMPTKDPFLTLRPDLTEK